MRSWTNYSPEYYWQKPHLDFANRIIHHPLYKKLNPLHNHYYYRPEQARAEPLYFGVPPGATWLYGNLDYTMNKHHRLYQAHDDWYPDRKNKSLGYKNGALSDKRGNHSTMMRFEKIDYPRGCVREVRKFQDCAKEHGKGSDVCFEKKLGIMEVCPNWVLHDMKEKKKITLRALSINNETYRRAMTVSPYNEGRTIADVNLSKTWKHGTAARLRPDSYWYDDRYSPEKHPHSHRYDANNFPDQKYIDFFGGNLNEEEQKAKDAHAIGFFKSLAIGPGEKKQDISGPPAVETAEEIKARRYSS